MVDMKVILIELRSIILYAIECVADNQNIASTTPINIQSIAFLI